MSARMQKKLRRLMRRSQRENVIRINRAMIQARNAQIRRALIGALIIGAFTYAISRVLG